MVEYWFEESSRKFTLDTLRFPVWGTFQLGTMVREDDWDAVVDPAYGVTVEENKDHADPATRARLRDAAYYPWERLLPLPSTEETESAD